MVGLYCDKCGKQVYVDQTKWGSRLFENGKVHDCMAKKSYSEIADKLEQYSNYEGTELGEYWAIIASLYRYTYCMSPEMEQALLNELSFVEEELDCYKLIEIKTTVETTRLELRYDGHD